MNAVDILCALIILIVGILGAKRGFFKVFVQFLSIAVAALLAKASAGFVSEKLYELLLQQKVADKLNDLLPGGSVSGGISTLVKSIGESLPTGVKKISDSLGLLSGLTKGLESREILTVSQIESEYAAPIITKVLTIVTSVLLFVVFALVLRMAANAIDKALFKKHGVVGTFNRICGFAFGALKGAVPVIFLCLILLVLAPVLEKPLLTAQVDGSFFCNWISNIFLR